jgi:hypothetical protein
VLEDDVRFEAFGLPEGVFDLAGALLLLAFRFPLLAGVAAALLFVLSRDSEGAGEVVMGREVYSVSDSAGASTSESDSSSESGVGSCVGSVLTTDTRDWRRECDGGGPAGLPGPLRGEMKPLRDGSCVASCLRLRLMTGLDGWVLGRVVGLLESHSGSGIWLVSSCMGAA